ncbi:MAG: hypothetical protein HY360_10670 [Verrucomicrobia bacterium]|nr:hypothetical protein [Verrucomicrobiota bacterium]
MSRLHFSVLVLGCLLGAGLGTVGLSVAAAQAGAEPKSIRLGDVSTGTLTYPALDNFNFREGTLECWVKFAFDPNEYLPAKGYTGMLVLAGLNGDKGGLGVHYSAQDGAKEAVWFCSIGPKPKFHGFGISAGKNSKFDVWQHFALVWKGREMTAYLDGKESGKVVHNEFPHQGFGDVGAKPIFFGDQYNRSALMVMDDLRISNVARKPEELGATVGELKTDAFTTLLDPFEGDFEPDGEMETKPLAIMGGKGGLPSPQCRFVAGRFGKGLAFFNE